ncbi:WD domain, G-beta repeat protein (macronuclear) [Tetrahymena thermophila SB210]|uniref:WD domain, G-beta repeat protein n=1 Tax=Tetrahymena thermophila (strain SB210) TaxID=312017 RepID=W7WXC9_TETTS|nr:WD domain, G-beta repeat protein [Tetrahymena thermophila SB210]EWS71460.1 WD domain, G-beta repeat protein [Tetrahymena thermophila SB210]|eukprot:XP_012656007.1 WD domain, G-beta repeat protein [Tetrahymena thermophila SB210]
MCVRNCSSQLFYQESSSKCVAICSSNEIADSEYRICRSLNLCSILSQQGNIFHSYPVSNILILTPQNTTQEVIISFSNNDNNIYMWDSQNGQLISEINVHTSPVLKIILLEDQNQILSFSQSGEVIIWNVNNGNISQKYNVTFGQLTENSELNDSRDKICSFGYQGEFYINDLKNKNQKQFIGHSNIVEQIIFLNEDNSAITSSLDNTILFWDLEQVNYYRLLCVHNGPPSQISLLQKKYLFSLGGLGSDGFSIKITDLSVAQSQCKSYNLNHKSPIINMILDQSLSRLASSYIQHSQEVKYLDYEDECSIFASTSLDGQIFIYDLTTGVLLQKFIHPSYVNTNPSQYPQGLYLQISRVGGIVCVSYSDFSVVCFNGITKKVISSINMKENILNIHKDDIGKYIAIVTQNTINSYNIITGQIEYQQTIKSGFLKSFLTQQQQLQLFTISQDLFLTYRSFPSLQILDTNDIIQSQFDSNYGNLQGYNFYVDFSFMIVYFSLGKVYLLDANLNLVKLSDEKTQLSVCIVGYYVVFCATGPPSNVIVRSFDDSYFFVDGQGYPLDPFLNVVVSYNFQKAFSVRNFGAFGGNILVGSLVDLSAEQSFYTNTVIIGLKIDDTRQRAIYYEHSGQITVSHFVPDTSSLLSRYNDTTPINKIYLLNQDNILLILSNYLSTISYLDYTLIMFNSFHNLPPTDCLIDNEQGIIYSYNQDIQNNLQMWYYKRGESVPLILPTKSKINGLAISKVENILFSYSQDGQIFIWDFKNVNLIKILSVNNQANIINLLLFNAYTPLCISISSDFSTVITNYQNGIIQRVITKNGSTNIVIDQDNQRLFILGQSIAVYQAASGQKITEFLQFDGTVQNLLIQDSYLIAYANQVIMSIDRTSLQQLFTGKFTRTIFQIQVMKNLVGMIAYKENYQIEIWNFQSGIMLSSIVDQQYGNPFINLFIDEESDFFLVQNTLNILETVLPFQQTISPIKDLIYTKVANTGDVESIIIDKQTNQLIIYNQAQIEIRKYYTYLGDEGSSFNLPSYSQVQQVYLQNVDIIIYIDNERKSWQMKENKLLFLQRLEEYPNNFMIFNEYLVLSNSKAIILLSFDLYQLSTFQVSQIQDIYPLETSNLLFAITEDFTIIQILLDTQSIQMKLLNTYDGTHSHRISKIVFNTQLNFFLASDVSGIISIHNYKTQKTIQIIQKNTQAVQQLILDSQLQMLFVCSQDGNLDIYNFEQKLNQYKIYQNIKYNTAVMQIQYDEIAKQLFVWNSLQQKVQVFNYQNQEFILANQILAPSDYGVQVKISRQFNLISIICTFQINFYNYSKDFQFLSYLRQPSSIYDIADIIFLSRQLIVVVCKSQILVLNISQQQASIQKKFPSLYSQIIFSQFEDNITVKLKGVNQVGIFNYTFVQELQPTDLSQICYYNFKQTSTYFQWLSDLNLQIQSQQILGQNQIQTQILTVEMSNNSEFNLIPQNQNQNQLNQIYTYSKEDDFQNSINIKFTSFLQFELEIIQIRDFFWVLDDYNQVKFNPKTQKIILMNQSLQSEFHGNSIQLQNLNQVIMQNITIQNSKFQNNNITQADNPYFYNIFNVNEVYISNIKITQSYFSNQVLLLIDSSNIVTIDTLEIDQIYYNNINSLNQQDVQNLLFNLIVVRNCINLTIKNVVFRSTLTQMTFIVMNLNANQNLIIEQFNAQNCQNIILLSISPTNYQQDKTIILQNDIIQLSQFQVSNCQTLENHPLIYLQSNNILINNTIFENNFCINSQGCSFLIQQSYFVMYNSIFIKQQSGQGGAISITNTIKTSLIQNCTFFNNTAFVGGAIYLQNSDIDVVNTTIIYNNAFIGGGIRYIQKIPKFIYQNQIEQTTNNISQNQAKVFGNNIGSYPRYMVATSLNTTIRSLQERISSNELQQMYNYQIDSFMSGDYFNIGLKVFDEEDNIVQYQPKDDIPDVIKTELNQYSINCLQGEEINLSGNTFFNEYNNYTSLFIIDNLILKGNPSSQREFYIQNQFIYVPSINNSQTLVLQNINIKVKVNFRKCLVGEIYITQTIDSPTYCMPCPQDKYSLIEQSPTTSDQTCKLCPDTAYKCQGSTIILKNGYWRENNQTDNIVYCKRNEKNCQGQESNNINYCAPGYVGPLCEQCDLIGDVWKSKYMNDGQYNCVACKDSIPLIFQYVGVALLSSIYLIYGIRQVIITTIVKIQCFYLRKMNLVCVSRSESRDQTDIYIKLLMHFMQVGSIVYQIQLPKIFQFLSVSIGSPLDTLKYSQDCRSVFLAQYIKPAYGRILWQQIIALGYIQFLMIFYFFVVITKIVRANKNYLINGFIFVFLFMQPNILSGLTSMMTCRQIGEKSYIAGDVTLICYSQEHKTFIGYLIIPLFIFWAIVLPFLWLYCLVINKNRLDNSITRLRFGPLYQEYKKVTYYWEITKINLKMLIIFVSTFFEDYQSIQGTLCTIILFLYLLLSFYKRPYISIQFNKTDQICNIILIICIQLNQFIQTTQQDQFLVLASNYLLIIINYSFMAYLIYKIIKSKLIKLITILIKKIYCLNNLLPKQLQDYPERQKNAFKNWKKALKLISIHLCHLKEQKAQIESSRCQLTKEIVQRNSLKFFALKNSKRGGQEWDSLIQQYQISKYQDNQSICTQKPQNVQDTNFNMKQTNNISSTNMIQQNITQDQQIQTPRGSEHVLCRSPSIFKHQFLKKMDMCTKNQNIEIQSKSNKSSISSSSVSSNIDILNKEIAESQKDNQQNQQNSQKQYLDNQDQQDSLILDQHNMKEAKEEVTNVIETMIDNYNFQNIMKFK